MQFNALIPELAVRDWQASIRFYCDLIGFSVAYDRPEEGFAFLELGEAQLMIDQLGVGRDFLFGEGPLQFPFGRGVNLQISVANVTPILTRLEAAGLEPFLPLEEKWYRKGDSVVGNRQFVIADPDGYLLRLTENLGERPA